MTCFVAIPVPPEEYLGTFFFFQIEYKSFTVVRHTVLNTQTQTYILDEETSTAEHNHNKMSGSSTTPLVK